jgi:hypothetical protein
MGLAMTLPGSASGQHDSHAHAPAAPGTIAIPPAMQAEHAAIHQQLERATALPGRTGAAARALAEVLHPHFLREEQIGLPPLGLLEPLARGEFTEAMTAVLPMTDSLRAELPRMLEEHKAIHAATVQLGEAAKAESQPEAAALASELAAHALAEEQLFYPAALLVGEVVKTRAAGHQHH